MSRRFGEISALPSGRFRARYIGPDGERYSGPITYRTKGDANNWLTKEAGLIAAGAWVPPAERDRYALAKASADFNSYLADNIAARELEERTREHYQQIIDAHITPAFKGMTLAGITKAEIKTWFNACAPNAPTTRSHAYQIVASVFKVAVSDGLIPVSPCQIVNGSKAKRKTVTRIATVDEINSLAKRMPDRLAPMVLIAGWTGLRFGEIIELRRGDIVFGEEGEGAILFIKRGAVRTKKGTIVKTPKSEAGERPVPVPAEMVPVLREHLRLYVGPNKTALLFPSATDPDKHLAPSTFTKSFYPARIAIDRPDLRFHDLRHTAGTRLAQVGATQAEVMAILGHSTNSAAQRYQHAASDRPAELARRLGALMG